MFGMSSHTVLDLVQRARVAQAQGVVGHVVLQRPRVDRQASALVRSNHHVVVVHAQDGGAHAVDEPDGLVEVLGQDHPRAREEGRLERRLGHELAADVVVHVALGVGRHNGKRSAVAEEGLRGEAVQAGAGAAADGEECRLRRLCQDVGHVVQRGDLVRDVAWARPSLPRSWGFCLPRRGPFPSLGDDRGALRVAPFPASFARL